MSGQCLVVRVSGAMDYASEPMLHEQLKKVISPGDRFIVLELTRVSFCDSAWLNVLLGARRAAEASGTVPVLACVPPRIRRLLEMTGVDQVLWIFSTVVDAEAALGG